MITINGDEVRIDIDAEEFFRSMALLKSMRDFCKEQTEDGVSDTVEALTVAIETMTAFSCEHFNGGLSEWSKNTSCKSR